MTARIAGTTGVIALIGRPVGHSLSPAMHNAAFEALGLDLVYVALPVRLDPAASDDAADDGEPVRCLERLGVVGANVTVPLKRRLYRGLTELDADARRLGAVNTLVREGDGFRGANTDLAGLREDLKAWGCPVADGRVLVLGAGGAARAAVLAVAELGARQITVCNRHESRARELKSALGGELERCGAELRTRALDVADAEAGEASLIIQATSVGLRRDDPSLLSEGALGRGQWALDLIYRDHGTTFLHEAAGGGAHIRGGLGMLLRQGAAAFRLWTGAEAPLEVMEAALADR